MKEFIEKTHTCSKCQATLQYTSLGGWYNAKTRINRGQDLHCQPCAGREGRANSSKKPTGRPKGSKTHPDKLINHSRPGAGTRLNRSLTFEQRMQGISRRNGYDTYQEYKESLPALKAYRIDVWRITNQQPLHLLENYNKRGVNGQTGAYTLDHIISVKRGFIENIPPEQIGHISNLQMLPWEENITKGWK
jgi:hypothetical protein